MASRALEDRLSRFRALEVDNRRLILTFFWVARGAATISIVAALSGHVLLAVPVGVFAGVNFWAERGFDLPGSAWAYYRSFGRKHRDWNHRVQWANEPPASRHRKGLRRPLSRIKPPASFDRKHQDLLAKFDEYGALRRSPRLNNVEWWCALAVAAIDCGISLDELIAGAKSTAPSYAGDLEQAKMTAKHEREQSQLSIDRAFEVFIAYLEKKPAPSAVASAQVRVRDSVRTYFDALRNGRQVVSQYDLDQVGDAGTRIEEARTDLADAMRGMYEAALR